jgi:hypothetical protein
MARREFGGLFEELKRADLFELRNEIHIVHTFYTTSEDPNPCRVLFVQAVSRRIALMRPDCKEA